MTTEDSHKQPGERKRHHFVSVTYLNSWAGEPGKLHAYRSDNQADPLYIRPKEIGFENYYYSQVREDGSRDNDSFEDLFGTVETHWPRVLDSLNAEKFDRDCLHYLYAMMTMMRTRVPAARDYQESLMALETRTSFKAFADMGKLPEKMKRYENELDTVEVTIDRQRTLGTMIEDMRRFGDMTRLLGFEILRDDTGTGFLTSDNPVLYFDPSDPGIRHPYIENSRIELFFPLTPVHVLHGATRIQHLGQVPQVRGISDAKKIQKINRHTSRFAYRLAFARDRAHDQLVQRHAATSPVFTARVVRTPKKIDYHIAHKFAARPNLPAFKPENCEDDLYEEDFEL